MKKPVLMTVLFIVCSLVLCAVAFAAGSSYTKQLTANYVGITLIVHGEAVTPKDVNGNTVDPFIVDGTTYLPVRAVAEALGDEVSWDGMTKTIYIGEKPEPIPEPTPIVPPQDDANNHSSASSSEVDLNWWEGVHYAQIDGELYEINYAAFGVRTYNDEYYMEFSLKDGWPYGIDHAAAFSLGYYSVDNSSSNPYLAGELFYSWESIGFEEDGERIYTGVSTSYYRNTISFDGKQITAPCLQSYSDSYEIMTENGVRFIVAYSQYGDEKYVNLNDLFDYFGIPRLTIIDYSVPETGEVVKCMVLE